MLIRAPIPGKRTERRNNDADETEAVYYSNGHYVMWNLKVYLSKHDWEREQSVIQNCYYFFFFEQIDQYNNNNNSMTTLLTMVDQYE